MLTVCNNISMENVIKRVKSVKLLNLKLLNHLNDINNRGILISFNIAILFIVMIVDVDIYCFFAIQSRND